jgi:hypothetical protein
MRARWRRRKNLKGGSTQMTRSSKNLTYIVVLALLGTISAIIAKPWKLIATPPTLVMESGEVDLGMLETGSHEFQLAIQNGGGGVLTISEIRASCGCTSVSNCGPIASGESGVIKGKVSVAPGSGNSNLLLVSNTSEGTHVVTVRWFGKRAPEVVPSVLEIAAKPNATCRQEVRIVHAGGQKLQIVGVSTRKVGVKWIPSSHSSDHRQEEKLVSEKGYIQTLPVILDVTAPQDVGEHSAPVSLRCRQGGIAYELRLQIKIEVLGGIYTHPRKVFLGGGTTQNLVGQRFSANIFTENMGDGIRVESKPAFLECNITQAKRLGSYQHILAGKVIAPPPEKLKDFSIILRNASGDSFALVGELIVGESRN